MSYFIKILFIVVFILSTNYAAICSDDFFQELNQNFSAINTTKKCALFSMSISFNQTPDGSIHSNISTPIIKEKLERSIIKKYALKFIDPLIKGIKEYFESTKNPFINKTSTPTASLPETISKVSIQDFYQRASINEILATPICGRCSDHLEDVIKIFFGENNFKIQQNQWYPYSVNAGSGHMFLVVKEFDSYMKPENFIVDYTWLQWFSENAGKIIDPKKFYITLDLFGLPQEIREKLKSNELSPVFVGTNEELKMILIKYKRYLTKSWNLEKYDFDYVFKKLYKID